MFVFKKKAENQAGCLGCCSCGVNGRKAQVSLEALILLAGLLAFWAAWFSVIGPVQEKAKALAVERLEHAAFERVAFALKLAERLGSGTRIAEEVYLPVETVVELDESLRWSFANTTWLERHSGSAQRQTLLGRVTAVAENSGELKLSWQN